MSSLVTLRYPVDTFVEGDVQLPGNQFINPLLAKYFTGDPDGDGFIYINWPYIQTNQGAEVPDARILLRAAGDCDGNLTAQRMTEAWLASEVTYPAYTTDGESTVALSGVGEGDLVEIDVTDIIQDATSGEDFFGFKLGTDSPDGMTFYSNEAADAALRPILLVTLNAPSDPPTDLRPSDGRRVSTATPTMTWTAHEPEEDPAAFWLQLTDLADDDFSSPELDTGWITSTLSRATLGDIWPTVNIDTVADGDSVSVNEQQSLWIDNPYAVSGYFPLTFEAETTPVPFDVDASGLEAALEGLTGLADVTVTGTGIEADPFLITFEDDFSDRDEITVERGVPNLASRIWRVKTRDPGGLASDYSASAAFGRTDKGTLSLTAPADETLEVGVQVAHDLDDAIQESTEYVLWRVDDGERVELYRRDRLATDADQFQVPVGYVDRYDADFVVGLFLWDTVDREETPGDPAYYYVEETFQLVVGDEAPDPVDSLEVARLLAGNPLTRIDFESDTADYWALILDGVIESARLTPATVEAGLYRLIRALAQGEHTIAVQRVVLDSGVYRHSEPVEVDYEQGDLGLWIVDPENAEALEILNPSPALTLFRTAIYYDVPGRPDEICLVTAVGGYRGTVNGEIVGSQARDLALKFSQRSLETHRFRYIHAGELNIPIRIKDLQVQPLAGDNGAYAVTVVVSQHGEYPLSLT